MAPLRRRQDDRDLLAVPERQLLGHPRGERVIPAQHQMIAAGRHRGIGGHGVILARPGRTHPKGVPAATAAGPSGWHAGRRRIGAPGPADAGGPGGRPPGPALGRGEPAELRRHPGGGGRGRSGTASAGGPRAPAAGTWTGPAPESASRIAPALSSPEAMIQTSRAAVMAGSVRVSRVGGGLGEPCTATTVRAPRTGPACQGRATRRAPQARCRAAARRTTGTWLWSSGWEASSSHPAYRAAAASGSGPSGPSDAGIGWTRSGLAST